MLYDVSGQCLNQPAGQWGNNRIETGRISSGIFYPVYWIWRWDIYQKLIKNKQNLVDHHLKCNFENTNSGNYDH